MDTREWLGTVVVVAIKKGAVSKKFLRKSFKILSEIHRENDKMGQSSRGC